MVSATAALRTRLAVHPYGEMLAPRMVPGQQPGLPALDCAPGHRAPKSAGGFAPLNHAIDNAQGIAMGRADEGGRTTREPQRRHQGTAINHPITCLTIPGLM